MQDLGQPIFYEIPKFHTSLLWCLPFDYEANNFSKNQDSNKVNIIEKRFDVIIKELNKEFRLAIENEEVRQDNEKITIKFHRSYPCYIQFMLNTSTQLIFTLIIFSLMSMDFGSQR